MNLNLNYYSILGVTFESTEKEIKKKYYKLSMDHHPDKGGNAEEFSLLNEAYTVLTEMRDEYDKKSKFGKDYNEIEELFKVELEWNHKEAESNFDKVKNREVLDIVIKVNKDTFDGTLEFPRFVLCKTCKGTGKDTSMKFAIKNDKGEVKYFEADDGCDFCEGSGKSWNGQDCSFCGGKGKVGIHPCKSCNGERRVLGKQKLTGIKLEGEETKIESMGHLSYYDKGKVGNLIIKILS